MAKNKDKVLKKTSIGGQALIEGVMMKGPQRTVMAVRNPEGEIVVEDFGGAPLKEKYKILGLPFIRGVVGFVESMVQGYKALMRSAEIAGLEEDSEEELSKFEKWLNKVFGEKLFNFLMVIAMVLGIGLAFFLFMYLPSLLYSGLEALIPALKQPDGQTVYRSIFEGVLKMIIFVFYIWLCGRMKELRRVFEYHGAEHKTIFCYEHGLELTVENVKKQIRFHPRCGTSFMILMLIIGMLAGMLIPDMRAYFDSAFVGNLVRALLKIALLPLVMAVGYELLKICGRYDNVFTRMIATPGLWMQRLTTCEPDDSQIECAIASMKAVIPEDGESDKW